MKVRIAVSPGLDGAAPELFGGLVDELERLGFDTIWLPDLPLGPALDPLTALAVAAGRTGRLKLGANLVPFGLTPYRLARQLAELDRLSGGRLLLSLVIGLDRPGERAALGIGDAHRGKLVEEIMPVLRALWAGQQPPRDTRWELPAEPIPVLPQQDPLELWLGGVGPKALERVGRVADGWLGAALTPPEAADAVDLINASATGAGRVVDPEHHGMSIGYARTSDASDAAVAAVRTRRPDVDPRELVPAGAAELRDLLKRYIDSGLSKFVLRPVSPIGPWAEELGWLADAVLDLQT